MSSSSGPDADASRLPFGRITPPRGLRHEVVARIKGDIQRGGLKPGSRLPTEQEMIAAFGVSRTVVREAVAALRAEGLVETRQGVGAFVTLAAPPPFRLEPGGLPSLDDVIHVMELRLGVESEAAGLAAERASRRDVRAIEQALKQIDRGMRSGGLAVEEDFAFHRSIAAATGNPQFVRFLEFLGRFIIPRQSVRTPSPESRAYLAMLQDEHRAIVVAIAAHSPADAQGAMRLHLTRSRERYAALAGSGGAADGSGA